jgi:hypothetical protein
MTTISHSEPRKNCALKAFFPVDHKDICFLSVDRVTEIELNNLLGCAIYNDF